MAKLTSRTTVYLNPFIKKCVQHKAVEEHQSFSSIVNDALTEMIKKEAGIKPTTVPKTHRTSNYTEWLRENIVKSRKI